MKTAASFSPTHIIDKAMMASSLRISLQRSRQDCLLLGKVTSSPRPGVELSVKDAFWPNSYRNFLKVCSHCCVTVLFLLLAFNSDEARELANTAPQQAGGCDNWSTALCVLKFSGLTKTGFLRAILIIGNLKKKSNRFSFQTWNIKTSLTFATYI